MSAIIDLNDCALKLWHEGATAASPGYAWFDGRHYQFGAAALTTRRRTPRSVNTRYWSHLDTQPLTPPLGPARHHADLVHDHLHHLHQLSGAPESVLAAVPGCMTREQLSLLLGIVEALPFQLTGLVHRTAALAASSALADGVHVELQLQQLVATPFSTDRGVVTAGQSTRIPGQGILALLDQLASLISQQFINQTRFDPLRSADSEQSLYDQLPELLETLQHQSESSLTIEAYNARIVREDLAPAGSELTQTISGLVDNETPLLLENPLCAVPGLQLPQYHQAVDSVSLLSVINRHYQQLQQAPDQLHLNKRVPRSDEIAADSAPAPNNPVQPLPSHLLIGHSAYKLSERPGIGSGIAFTQNANSVTITADEDSQITINGQPLSPGQTVQSGDVIADNQGFMATLITVEN